MYDARQRFHLAQQEGYGHLSAAEAILKGVLESALPIHNVVGPRVRPFAAVLDLGRDETVQTQLGLHRTRMSACPDAARAVTIAGQVAVAGRRAIAMIPNDQLDRARPALISLATVKPGEGGLTLLVEDDPVSCPGSSPRDAAVQLDLPCLEPADLAQLREGIEHAFRIGRAGDTAVLLVVHRDVLNTTRTTTMRANRVLDPVHTSAGGSTSRRSRIPETSGILPMVRRLEINPTWGLPSPGERVPVGFAVIGPAQTALAHVVHVLSLHGRVPIVQFGLVSPLDEPLVERLLGRCEQVVVLEARPGGCEAAFLSVAESMRHRGDRPALVWSRFPPPDPSGRSQAFNPNDSVHPSLLARRIMHLLHLIRPTLDMSASLAPTPSELPLPVPPRREHLGPAGARAHVHGVLAEVDQWLAEQPPESAQKPRRALAIDGDEPRDGEATVVRAETWSEESFATAGLAALHDAAASGMASLMIVTVLTAGRALDFERLARGAVPGRWAERVRIVVTDLNDHVELRELLQEQTQLDGVCVVVAADGPPPRFDVGGLEQARADVDRLGYEPRQRMVWSTEGSCALRSGGGVRGSRPGDPEPAQLVSRWSAGRPSPRQRGQVGIRVRPVLEQVEVVRDQPPVMWGRQPTSDPLLRPEPVHARQSHWRAHLAGFRGIEPGVTARVLSDAATRMGYHVTSVHDPTPIGPGRRGWVQVLFMRPRPDQPAPPYSARIPYGEADLLLGLAWPEALRAVDRESILQVAHHDRTAAVVNSGTFADDLHPEPLPPAGTLGTSFRAVCHDTYPTVVEDFASACRAAFQTDRVVDLVLLGTAFQHGLIPLSPEAIEGAVRREEAAGIGRALEAFRFGRTLTQEPRFFIRRRDPRGDDVQRLIRRAVLLAHRTRRLRAADVEYFGSIVRRTIDATPGLAETDAGRQARRDLVAAMERCLIWDGPEMAQQYADRLTTLYRADRGDTGRALTRDAVVPLAEAMLVRDPLHLAGVAMSPFHRRRIRARLSVKLARGDRLSRRFLLRLELVVLHRRYRLDIRSGEWPVRMLSSMRGWMPHRWRGSRRDRRVRKMVIEVVDRASREAHDDYDRWSTLMHKLHELALDERLRTIPVADLQLLIDETLRVDSSTPQGPSA